MNRKLSVLLGVVAVVLIMLSIKFGVFSESVENVSCKNCNVIIVGYDTVGSKHVSNLGYKNATTPQLDKLASQGVAFSNYYSVAPWTVPSFMSLFTGLYPTEHKVVNKFTVFDAKSQVISNLKKLSPKVETLAQQFKNNGYVTGGFTGDAGVGAQFGYSTGFDEYFETPPFGSIGVASDKALEWLGKNPDKKFFMFLHGYDSHGQFKTQSKDVKNGEFVPKNYNGKLVGSNKEEELLREKQLKQKLGLSSSDFEFLSGVYDSKIKDGDAHFGNFLEGLTEIGRDKNTIIVVLSDHGEEWGEHGGVDHGHTIYNELVRVPLVFKIPGAKPRSTLSKQVSSINIAPTLLDITEISPSAQYQSQIKGTSLLPLLEGRKLANQEVFLETDYLDFTHIRGVISKDGWKYIITEQTGAEELYNLNKDPEETQNLINEKSSENIASSLRRRVRDHLIAMGDNPDKKWTVGCLPVYPVECRLDEKR